MLSKTGRKCGVCDDGLIAKYRVGSRPDGAFDLWGRQTPTASL